MSDRPRQLHLNAHMGHVGRHNAAWRIHDDPRAYLDVRFLAQTAQVAERGKLDAVFVPDGTFASFEFDHGPAMAFDPIVTLSAVSVLTEHIGLIGTFSTTFDSPYALARRLGSLDHASGGRVGWNIVTGSNPREALNHSLDEMPSGPERYLRADEFVEVVTKLWASWGPDAFVGDAAAGVFADRTAINPIDHVGEHYRVRGPLPFPASVQGSPVLVQAGSSGPGRDLAARWAEVAYTAQTTIDSSLDYAHDRRRRAALAGRPSRVPLIFPGIFPILGGTEDEAWRNKAELDQYLDFADEAARLSIDLGLDPEELRLDERFPIQRLTSGDVAPGVTGSRAAILELVRTQDLTVREYLIRNPGPHRVVVGTPEQIADDIEQWFAAGAADGFNVSSALLPNSLEEFVDQVVPILQRRDLFRTEYDDSTLRGRLGLEGSPGAARLESALVR